MKSLKFALAAAAVLLACSCEQIIDSVLTEPTFSLYSDIYDGQTCKLVKISACNYAWETSSPSEAVVNVTGKKKRAWLTVKLINSNLPKSITVTATNADDPSIEPCVLSTTVHPWRLWLYEKIDGKWSSVGDEVDIHGNGGRTFQVRMQALQANGGWKDVERIPYDGSDYASLTWDRAGLGTDKGAKKVTFEFTVNSVIPQSIIKATLGEVTKTIKIYDSTY